MLAHSATIGTKFARRTLAQASTKIQNEKVPSAARGSFFAPKPSKQLISSTNCRFTAVSGGKSRSIIETKPNRRVLRGGRLRLAMPKMKEQNSRSQRRRTAFCKREQNTKISFFAVRIFNLTRIEGFVKGEIANIFSMRHFRYKVSNFSKIFRKSFQNMPHVVTFNAR